MSFVIAVFSFRLDVEIENEGLEDNSEPKPFIEEVTRNFKEIGQAFQVKEYYSVILYLILTALVVPSFGTYGFFFMLDVVEISKFTYSMLTVLGFFCLLIGSTLYGKYCCNMEFRSLIILDTVIGVLFAPFSFMFVLRLNEQYGIPDLFLLIFCDVVQDIISMCFVFMPMSVLMAKICPKRIEATSFALLAGVSNFRGTIRGRIGTWINDAFVGVSREDLSDYYILVTIGFFCSFIPLLFLRLIPTRKDIEILQASMNQEENEETTDDTEPEIIKGQEPTSDTNKPQQRKKSLKEADSQNN